MANVEFVDIDKMYLQSRLNAQHEESQSAVNGVARLIRTCQREYNRLSDIVQKSDTVFGISAAVGFISAIPFFPSEVESVAEEVVEKAPELITTPAGKVLLAGAVGGFAIAGISNLISKNAFRKMQENREQQEELYVELDLQQSFLTASENKLAINEIKEAIHGEVTLPQGFTSTFSEVPSSYGLAGSLPKIEVINMQKDFLPPSQDSTFIDPTDDFVQ